MDTPNERCWSFAYQVGESRYSFNVIAPTREIAESVARTATCEGAIASASSAYDARQSLGVASPA